MEFSTCSGHRISIQFEVPGSNPNVSCLKNGSTKANQTRRTQSAPGSSITSAHRVLLVMSY